MWQTELLLLSCSGKLYIKLYTSNPSTQTCQTASYNDYMWQQGWLWYLSLLWLQCGRGEQQITLQTYSDFCCCPCPAWIQHGCCRCASANREAWRNMWMFVKPRCIVRCISKSNQTQWDVKLLVCSPFSSGLFGSCFGSFTNGFSYIWLWWRWRSFFGWVEVKTCLTGGEREELVVSLWM